MGLAAGATGEQLQLADPQEGWGYAGCDRRRIVDQDVGVKRARIRGVPGPANGFGAGHIERQGAGGGNPQGVHELLRQKLADAGAEHGASISTPAVGRRSTALELHLPTSALENTFEHGNGPAIAVAVAGSERALLHVLAAVDGKGVAGGPTKRSHRLRRRADIAGKQTAEVVVVDQLLAQAQVVEEGCAVRHVLRRWDWRGGHRHVVTGEHLAGPVIVAIGGGLGVGAQGIQQRIVGPLRKVRKRCCRHG